jgi:hypothetical protein
MASPQGTSPSKGKAAAKTIKAAAKSAKVPAPATAAKTARATEPRKAAGPGKSESPVRTAAPSNPRQEVVDTSRHHLVLMRRQLDEAIEAFGDQHEAEVVRQLKAVETLLEQQQAYLDFLDRSTVLSAASARGQLTRVLGQLRARLRGTRGFAQATLVRRPNPLPADAIARLLNTIEEVTANATRAITRLEKITVEVTK